MVKCGLNQPNLKLFLKDLVAKEKRAALDCLMTKDSQIKAEKQAKEAKEIAVKALKEELKNCDCSTESGYVKKLCEYNKGNYERKN